MRKNFETHLEDLNKLTPDDDEQSYADVFAATKATSILFKKHVRVAEKRIREGKPATSTPAKKCKSEASA